MKESAIRSTELVETYLSLCRQDSKIYFSNTKRVNLACPGCGGKENKKTFEKWGFDFAVCKNCGTLYQTPRPPKEAFNRFYQESPSSKYWATTFFPAVAEARRTRLFRPKAKEISAFCKKKGLIPETVADVGAGFGIFLEEWHSLHPESKPVAIEPNPEMAALCRQKGLNVIESFAEDVSALAPKFDLLVAFELIEHAHDPLRLCLCLRRMINRCGRVLITGLTAEGFDIQVLWQDSKSVSPPHHINFMSIRGVELLLKRAGFNNISISTPGMLDTDIVKNALHQKGALPPNLRFIETLIGRGDNALDNFQKFLQHHNLSSHFWAWASIKNS